MNIPIEDNYSFQAQVIYCVLSSNSNVVEEAEARHIVTTGMMPWWSDSGKCCIN
jgi:hypothetical protein